MTPKLHRDHLNNLQNNWGNDCLAQFVHIQNRYPIPSGPLTRANIHRSGRHWPTEVIEALYQLSCIESIRHSPKQVQNSLRSAVAERRREKPETSRLLLKEDVQRLIGCYRDGTFIEQPGEEVTSSAQMSMDPSTDTNANVIDNLPGPEEATTTSTDTALGGRHDSTQEEALYHGLPMTAYERSTGPERLAIPNIPHFTPINHQGMINNTTMSMSDGSGLNVSNAAFPSKPIVTRTPSWAPSHIAIDESPTQVGSSQSYIQNEGFMEQTNGDHSTSTPTAQGGGVRPSFEDSATSQAAGRPESAPFTSRESTIYPTFPTSIPDRPHSDQEQPVEQRTTHTFSTTMRPPPDIPQPLPPPPPPSPLAHAMPILNHSVLEKSWNHSGYNDKFGYFHGPYGSQDPRGGFLRLSSQAVKICGIVIEFNKQCGHVEPSVAMLRKHIKASHGIPLAPNRTRGHEDVKLAAWATGKYFSVGGVFDSSEFLNHYHQGKRAELRAHWARDFDQNRQTQVARSEGRVSQSPNPVGLMEIEDDNRNTGVPIVHEKISLPQSSHAALEDASQRAGSAPALSPSSRSQQNSTTPTTELPVMKAESDDFSLSESKPIMQESAKRTLSQFKLDHDDEGKKREIRRRKCKLEMLLRDKEIAQRKTEIAQRDKEIIQFQAEMIDAGDPDPVGSSQTLGIIIPD